jgi:hypothetical protein
MLLTVPTFPLLAYLIKWVVRPVAIDAVHEGVAVDGVVVHFGIRYKWKINYSMIVNSVVHCVLLIFRNNSWKEKCK